MRHSTARTSSTKPDRRKGFPLFAHAAGVWAKKVRGKLHYFGPWSDPDAALKKWLDEKDDLLAGRTPRRRDGLLVGDLCNQFLTSKRDLVDAGELSARHWGDYYAVCESVVKVFGRNRLVEDLRPEDFQKLRRSFAKRCGPVRLGNQIQRVRSVLKWAYDSELIERPVRTGPDFRKPAKHVIRKARANNGPRMFEPAELLVMLDKAQPQLRAMLYLALNGGLGNTDCGLIRLSNLDLKKGWLNFPRPKTGIPRRCPLWTKTVAALKEALDDRPEPAESAYADRVFLTADGLPWTADAKIKKEGGAGPRRDCVTQCFRQLLDDLGFHRPGWGFYTLRHVFETIAGGKGDQITVDAIMGHADHTMASHYRERIDDDRLVAVTEHVRKWLFAKPKKKRA